MWHHRQRETKAPAGAGSVPFSLPRLDQINRRTYRRPRVVNHFGRAEGWLDIGERKAVEFVADKVQGKPILDLGVGGGRTAPLLSLISTDYQGVDYEALMVAAARRRFPHLNFVEMDARSLEFPGEMFGLVMFSFNGIDSVDPEGRRQILREVHRVLEPGGFFVFSALNRSYAEVARHWPDWTVFQGAGLSILYASRSCVRLLLGGLNRLRLSRLIYIDPNLAIGPIPAHSFGLAAVFTSLPEQVAELRDTNFVVDAILAENGASVSATAAEANTRWCYYVARKN